jgi:Ca-activated chloride channel homolog
VPVLTVGGWSSPWWLLLVAVVAALVGGYVLVQRGRRRSVLRFSNLEMLDRVAPKRRGWIRHVPAAVLGVALILLIVGLAGPTADAKIPRNRATVMLAIDVSLSMRATDIEPTRMAAAQDSAKRFADSLPPGVNMGVVSFSGVATVLMAPTTDRAAVKQAIDGLTMSEATATGDGINAALSSIASFARTVSGPEGPPPARIVLMSDGKQTIPPDENSPRGSFTRAKEARNAHVPISTIAFGTDYGTVDLDGEPVAVPADRPAMQRIAELSGGDFSEAASAGELRRVYDKLGDQIGYELRHTDVGKPWLELGTIMAIVAAAWSLVLGQRLP